MENARENLGRIVLLQDSSLDRRIKEAINRASDRVRQKMGNSAAFSREIMRQERSIMRQIMRFF